jgi:hypothetical protein
MPTPDLDAIVAAGRQAIADAPDLAEDGTPLFDDDLLVLVKGW